MASRTPLTIELTHFWSRGRVISTLEGRLEGHPDEVLRLFYSEQFELADLDPRLNGTAIVDGRVTSSGHTDTFAFKVNPPLTVEGRALEVGDRVHMIADGKIMWRR